MTPRYPTSLPAELLPKADLSDIELGDYKHATRDAKMENFDLPLEAKAAEVVSVIYVRNMDQRYRLWFRKPGCVTRHGAKEWVDLVLVNQRIRAEKREDGWAHRFDYPCARWRLSDYPGHDRRAINVCAEMTILIERFPWLRDVTRFWPAVEAIIKGVMDREYTGYVGPCKVDMDPKEADRQLSLVFSQNRGRGYLSEERAYSYSLKGVRSSHRSTYEEPRKGEEFDYDSNPGSKQYSFEQWQRTGTDESGYWVSKS